MLNKQCLFGCSIFINGTKYIVNSLVLSFQFGAQKGEVMKKKTSLSSARTATSLLVMGLAEKRADGIPAWKACFPKVRNLLA